MKTNLQTCEFVSAGHPDKVCDQISDAVTDNVLDIAVSRGVAPETCRAAIETVVKERLVVVTGEVNGPRSVLSELDIEAAVAKVWSRVGYDPDGPPTIINYVKRQSDEIAAMVDKDGDASGAGDQGIMCGYACRENPDLMPREYVAARELISALDRARTSGQLPYLRNDAKSQVTMTPDGDIEMVVISTQHTDAVKLDQLRDDLARLIVRPVLGEIPAERMKLNHRGSFVLGGAMADAGVTGRKIVVDQVGPRAPVGGGAFSGKDPSKVDRSAAYMARNIAKTALSRHMQAKSCLVQLSYGIGQVQPTSVMARLDGMTDISDWVLDVFPDLSPKTIQAELGLWERKGWTYLDTAAGGHFGRSIFPWERVNR